MEVDTLLYQNTSAFYAKIVIDTGLVQQIYYSCYQNW